MCYFYFLCHHFKTMSPVLNSSLVFSSNLIQHDKNWHQYTGRPPIYGEVLYIKLETKKLLPSSMHKNCHFHDFFQTLSDSHLCIILACAADSHWSGKDGQRMRTCKAGLCDYEIESWVFSVHLFHFNEGLPHRLASSICGIDL